MMYSLSTVIERLEKQATADEEHAEQVSAEIELAKSTREGELDRVRDRQGAFIDKLIEWHGDSQLDKVYEEVTGYGYRRDLQPPKVDTEAVKKHTRLAGRSAAIRDIVTMLRSSGSEQISTGELEKLGILPFLKL